MLNTKNHRIMEIKRTELMGRLGGLLGTRNLPSPKTRRPVANQFQTTFAGGEAFSSYGVLIAVRIAGRLYLTDMHDYSKTTAKYATEWTGLTTDQRRKGLKDGTITLITD